MSQTQRLTCNTFEAAEKLGIGVETLRDRVKSGEWPCTRMGRSLRFTDQDLTDILELSRQAPIAKKPRARKAS